MTSQTKSCTWVGMPLIVQADVVAGLTRFSMLLGFLWSPCKSCFERYSRYPTRVS